MGWAGLGRFARYLAAAVTMWVLAAPAQAADRVALVIGNASYDEAPLRNPTHDADAMESALSRLGFDVVKLRDGSLREMQRAIGQFSRKLKGSRTALVYYSGHGIQSQGTNYLIPVDARLESEGDIPLETVSLDAIMVQLAQAQTPVNLVILDACRNDPFAKQRSIGGASPLAGLAPVLAPRGTLIAYATAPGQVAEDGDGANSPFTASLLQVIERPGLKAEDVFKETRIRLAENTGNHQVSWESSSLTGDFYFAAPPAAPARIATGPQQAPAPTSSSSGGPLSLLTSLFDSSPEPAANGAPATMAKRGKLVFDVENATKQRVSELYFVPNGNKSWEGNVLDEDNMIDSKNSVEVTVNDGLDACVYNILAVFGDGRKQQFDQVNICNIQRFVIR
jgi:uncharacterized caspase-like protein